MPSPSPQTDEPAQAGGSQALLLLLAWALVGVPLAWGLWQTIIKSLQLFR